MKDAIPPRSVQLPRHAREAILVNGLAEKPVPRRASPCLGASAFLCSLRCDGGERPVKLQYLDCPDNEALSGESHCYWRRHLELLEALYTRYARDYPHVEIVAA